MNKAFKNKIINKESTIGTIVSLDSICVSEVCARAGYDFLWIDFEHSFLSYEDVLQHITVARSTNTATLVRVPQNDLTATKKIMEMGPDGIIFPMVRSVEEAKKLIDFTIYPPEGTRGFAPMGAIEYGLQDINEYVKNSTRDFCRFVQLECIELIEHLDELLENDYIDGFIFGPNDLSGTVGSFLNVFDEEITKVIKDAIVKIKSKNKSVGLATGSMDRKVIRYWKDMGFDLMAAGGDYMFLTTGCLNLLNIMKEECK